MKEMNRREFLTLSGAAVVALSLAGCGGGPSAPPAPPASESKELALFRAINEVWYEVNRDVVPNPKLDICKSVAYCQEAADLAKFTASPFETYEPEVDEEDYRKWNLPDDVFHEYQLRESEMIQEIRNKYGNGTYQGTATGFGGDITVEVTITDGRIAAVDILSAEKEDSAYLTMANDIIPEILDAQSADVDTISGATFSSTGIKNATAQALAKGGAR